MYVRCPSDIDRLPSHRVNQYRAEEDSRDSSLLPAQLKYCRERPAHIAGNDQRTALADNTVFGYSLQILSSRKYSVLNQTCTAQQGLLPTIIQIKIAMFSFILSPVNLALNSEVTEHDLNQ